MASRPEVSSWAESAALEWQSRSAPTLVYGGVSSFDIPLVPPSAQVDRDSLFSWHFEVLRQAMQGVPQEIADAVQPPVP
jgi:hypothetical protein